MSVSSSRHRRIADRLFYFIIGLLVLVLGGLGSVIIRQRMDDASQRIARTMDVAANYLERVLPQSVEHLDAKSIRQDIESSASEELQAVEIFDADDERAYVYEREGGAVFDKKVARDLVAHDLKVGKMVAYFSSGRQLDAIRIREILRLVVMISAAGLALGGGLYLFVRRFIIKPIDATLLFSKEIAGGNYDRRIEVKSDDEMGLLQESLNAMTDALQESVEDLKASFAEAEGARQRALEALQVKSEFLARMSHEIRTPVNAIVGFADILLDDEKDEERRNGLKTIIKSANILLENINDTLDFAKIEAEKLKLLEGEFLLKDLFEEIAPLVEQRLSGKGVNFSVNLNDAFSSRTIVGDRVRLRQVLLNILINAAKFTHKGKIELSAAPTPGGETISFRVVDTGIGIPKEHHESIFEPFTQVDGSSAREYGGTGLGLAIAKRLVEMMNGRIDLESEAGKGTTFAFVVPLKWGPVPSPM